MVDTAGTDRELDHSVGYPSRTVDVSDLEEDGGSDLLWEARSEAETAHLLRSPANAERLRSSIADARAGRGEQHDLIDQPETQAEVTEHEDGVVGVRPVLAVPATEAWFWTERWQAGEREVDEDVRDGRITTSESVEEFMSNLVRLDEEAAVDEGGGGSPMSSSTSP